MSWLKSASDRYRSLSIRDCVNVGRSIALGGATCGAVFLVGSAPVAAQDDWRSEIRRLELQLDGQQKQIDFQSRVIENQKRRLDDQARELTGLRRSTAGAATNSPPDSVEFERSRPGNDTEPVELAITPLLTASANYRLELPDAERFPARADANDVNDRLPESSRLEFGYSNGFFIASPSGVTRSDGAPFVLQINGRLQLRHTAFDSDGPTPDENNLELERARVMFSGQVFSPDLSYLVQLDGDSDDKATVDFIDYYLTYDIGHVLWNCDLGTMGMKLGKYRLPFTRARQDSGFVLQFVDRATVSEFFDVNRSIAVGLIGKCCLNNRPVAWEVAISNGLRNDRFAPGRVGELDRNPGYAARISSELLGTWGTDGEPDLRWHECPAVKVGAAVAFTRVDRDDGLLEFSTIPVIGDSGINPFAVDVLPATVDEFGVMEFAVDANFKYRGFTVLSEYYMRELTEFAGEAVPDLFDHGFIVQAGYFVIPEKLEVAGRWSRMVGDSWSLGSSDHSTDELAAAMTWYIRRHNFKICFDVTHLNGSPIGSPTLNVQAGDDGWLFRTQLQLMF